MKPIAALDIECFSNWFLIGITDKVTGTEWDYQHTDTHPLDVASVTTLCQHFRIVTFNGVNYDVPMLLLALQGATPATLKDANDNIIVNGMKPWDFFRYYGCYPPDWLEHVDVSEPTPGVKISLKQYACRMHSRVVQDSPVDFAKPLPLEQTPHEIAYCRNDRRVTLELYDAISSRLDMRERLSQKYGVDLRSKSDAQMAEAVVRSEWARMMGELASNGEELPVNDYDLTKRGHFKPRIPKYPHGYSFHVRVPEHVHFVTPYMKELLRDVKGAKFVMSDKEEAVAQGFDGKNIRTGVQIPEVIKGRDIVIGGMTYRMGIGGLHSQESSVSYHSIPGVQTLYTADVISYYPSRIVNEQVRPAQLGYLFQTIYGGFYRERLEGKDRLHTVPKGSKQWIELDTVVGGFKIFLNGTFGKLLSRFSIFFAPELGMAVTIGGQLSLLMLIERFHLSGIRVVSANTDGVEIIVPNGREIIAKSIMNWWQRATSLALESKSYMALYSRDVNNYISLGFDGSVKRKGIFGESGVLKNKHPDLDICADAVVAYLSKGTHIADTIYSCKDIRRFIRVRGARGGARLSSDAPEVNYGRAVRWYYGYGCSSWVVDAASGNKVAGSDGARLVMTLPDALPDDIDYAHYIEVAEKMLLDIGCKSL